MESYFTFKYYSEIICLAILVSMLVIISIFLIIHILRNWIIAKMIVKFFTSHGYERELLGVPSVGTGAFYGWVRKSDYKIADDRDIRHMSLKRIKELYK